MKKEQEFLDLECSFCKKEFSMAKGRFDCRKARGQKNFFCCKDCCNKYNKKNGHWKCA